MTILVLCLLGLGFFYLIAKASTQGAQMLMAGLWVILGLAAISSIAGVLLFG